MMAVHPRSPEPELEPAILDGRPARDPRLPPHDLQSEAAVLSAIILDPDRIPVVLEILDANDFYSDNHRLVFDAVFALYTAGEPIDTLTVSRWLRKEGLLQRAGGSKYLVELVDSTPAVAHVEQHARYVLVEARKRSVMREAQKISAEGYGITTETWADESWTRLRDAAKCRDASPIGSAWRPLSPDLLLTPPPPRRWLLRHPTRGGQQCAPGEGDGLLPLGRLGMIAAEGGAGKTMVLCQLAIAVVLGKSWFGHFHVDPRARGKRVLLALAEETRDAADRTTVERVSDDEQDDEIHRRLYDAARAMRLSDDECRRAVRQIVGLGLAGKPCSLVRERVSPGGERDVIESPTYHALREKLEQDCGGGWALVVLDPLARWSGGAAESDNELATRFIQIVESLANVPGRPTILIAHHSSKLARREGDVDSRGVTALTDGIRWLGTLRQTKDEQLEFIQAKSNYSVPMKDPVVLERGDNGVLRAVTEAELEARREEAEEATEAVREAERRALFDRAVGLIVEAVRAAGRDGVGSRDGLIESLGLQRTLGRSAFGAALDRGLILKTGKTRRTRIVVPEFAPPSWKPPTGARS